MAAEKLYEVEMNHPNYGCDTTIKMMATSKANAYAKATIMILENPTAWPHFWVGEARRA